VVVLLLLLTIFNISALAEKPPIMMVDDIEVGQQGYAKTVFKGTNIEEFPIEIIDIIEDQNLDTDMILIKASGEKIEMAGGVASGMSGSPVYINNKLIGAISYKWQEADHRFALVTPIIKMLKLKKDTQDVSFYKSLKAANTPIMIGGLTGRSFDRLKNNLDIKDSRFISTSSTSQQSVENPNLEAGSALAIQLVRGDISVASIGTVTLVDNNEVYAFGHPFMNKGKSNFLMSKAYINAIIPSRSQPFKIGSPMDKLLGVIENDRNAGVYGKINKFPNRIPLTVKVEDKNSGDTKEVRTQIINDEKLLSELGSSIILQTIDSSLDRIGYGTSKVSIEIMGSNLPDSKVVRENMYYSNNDIAVSTLSDYYRMMNLITKNPFKEINIFDIKVNIETTKTHDVALIQEAEVLNEKIYPGSKLKLNVVFRPYRSEAISREVTIDIPKDINTGRATLAISGGYSGLPNQREPQDDSGNDVNQAVIEGYKSFDQMLTDYVEAPMNNELVLQIYPSFISRNQTNKAPDNIEEGTEETEQETPEDEETITPEKPEEKPEIKKHVYTDYVLEGTLTLDFEVKNIPEDNGEKNMTEDRKE
jgi:hypothetical protein